MDGYRSRFRHETEVAQAGYYAVTLDDYQVRAEATVAPHAGILRFTFPRAETGRVQIDLARRIGGTSTRQYIKVVDDHTIQGWMKCPPAGGGWGNGDGKANYTVYFHAEFRKPFSSSGTWKDGVIHARAAAESGRPIGAFVDYETSDGEAILVKVGISLIDAVTAGAGD